MEHPYFSNVPLILFVMNYLDSSLRLLKFRQLQIQKPLCLLTAISAMHRVCTSLVHRRQALIFQSTSPPRPLVRPISTPNLFEFACPSNCASDNLHLHRTELRFGYETVRPAAHWTAVRMLSTGKQTISGFAAEEFEFAVLEGGL